MIIVLTDHLKGQGRPAFRQFDGPRVVPGEETQIGLAVGSQVDGLLWAGGIDFLPRLRIDAVLKLRSDMVGSDPQVILTSLGYRQRASRMLVHRALAGGDLPRDRSPTTEELLRASLRAAA